MIIVTEKQFNETFSNNYDNFRYYTSTVLYNNYNQPNDGIKDERVVSKVHDVYEKIRERVIASAVTATTIVAYVKSIIRHALYDDVRPDLLKNRRRFKPIQNGVGERVDAILLDEQDEQNESLEYREKSMYYSKKIFQYIERNYDDKQCYIFRTYYLMEKRMTYQKLSEQTGYSKATCSVTIKLIKKDLRNNFNDWLKNNP